MYESSLDGISHLHFFFSIIYNFNNFSIIKGGGIPLSTKHKSVIHFKYFFYVLIGLQDTMVSISYNL